MITAHDLITLANYITALNGMQSYITTRVLKDENATLALSATWNHDHIEFSVRLPDGTTHKGDSLLEAIERGMGAVG